MRNKFLEKVINNIFKLFNYGVLIPSFLQMTRRQHFGNAINKINDMVNILINQCKLRFHPLNMNCSE